ncbi:hypothetical protein GCM10025864_29640 [Luteimicrobium album]|uniref:Orn/DAP/Arg decarboxylase 2 N-terminal domain-containing protein n=1 Tax=Luteimicrobium album TaxID=1054550 RepID=A0ABQ6I3Y7_9MICO|nr:hypothetical protein GCM10025864_29640 [Luteimicrobium album]
MTAGALPEPWSRGTVRGADGAMSVGGVDLRELAAEQGTPSYVLDEADFRSRARAYRTAFEQAFAAVGSGVDVYYAGKALLTVAVARWAREEGLRVDTASGGELAVTLRAGVPGPSSACTATTSPTPSSSRRSTRASGGSSSTRSSRSSGSRTSSRRAAGTPRPSWSA